MLRIPKNRKQYLARMLRMVADMHDEMRHPNQYDRFNNGWFASGICLACEEAAISERTCEADAWDDYEHLRPDINSLLLDMQDGYEDGCFLDPQPCGGSWKDWNQRATMCLFMALWLEDDAS